MFGANSEQFLGGRGPEPNSEQKQLVRRGLSGRTRTKTSQGERPDLAGGMSGFVRGVAPNFTTVHPYSYDGAPYSYDGISRVGPI